jgi:hypothetical protein
MATPFYYEAVLIEKYENDHTVGAFANELDAIEAARKEFTDQYYRDAAVVYPVPILQTAHQTVFDDLPIGPVWMMRRS